MAVLIYIQSVLEDMKKDKRYADILKMIPKEDQND